MACGMIDSNQKILVIDDDKDIAEVLGLILETEGYNPLVKYTGRDALDAVRIFAPNLVMLDIILDGVDGLEICKALKSDPDLKEIPVILVSATKHYRSTKGGQHDGFIAKPFNVEDIVSTVNDCLKVA